METLYGPHGLSYEDELQRLKNYDVCERFLAIEGSIRSVARYEEGLVTDTGTMRLTYAYGDEDPRGAHPIPVTWKQMHDFALEGKFDDRWKHWRLSNAKIYTTPDPNLMYIECDGQSMLYDPACHGEYGYYLNHYILTVEFKDGKIDMLTETYNTAAVYRNFGWHKEPPVYF